MTQIEGVESLAGPVAGITIDGPQTDDDRVDDVDEEQAAPGGDRDPDELEQGLAEALGPDIDSVRIEGPDGTTGAEAIEAVMKRAVGAEQLFDDEDYVTVPRMDGQNADTLQFRFGGGVAFEASDKFAQKLFEKLALGKDVELRVAAEVVTKAGAWKRKADETEVVTGKIGLKVVTMYVLDPEEL